VIMVNPDLPVPLHVQLSQVLREKISDGTLTIRVPSIMSLAQEYGVSHRTAEHALRTLADEGLIVAVTGKGYWINS
jgi:DNA-binding GntR family transcriptional regulator